MMIVAMSLCSGFREAETKKTMKKETVVGGFPKMKMKVQTHVVLIVFDSCHELFSLQPTSTILRVELF